MGELEASTMPVKLTLALLGAQAEARAVERDGKMDAGSQKYRYATAESMIQEGRTTLARAKLALIQGSVELGRSAGVTEQECGATARIHYQLVHESGESFAFSREWPCVSHRGRPLDKAVGGALTTCLSYTIRDLLLIPRDDDQADMDRRNDERESERERETTTPARSESKPANDARPEEQSKSKAPSPKEVLELVRERKLSHDQLTARIAELEGANARAALTIVVEAYGAPNKSVFTGVASSARKAELPKDWTDWILDAIRPRFDELTAAEPKPQAKGAA